MIAACIVVLLAATPPVAEAQRPNRQVFEDLGVRCLSDAPAHADSFQLAAPDSMPYLRSALVQQWMGSGRQIQAEGAPPEGRPLLRYDVRQARVTYRRSGRGRFERTVSLSLDYTLTDAHGTIQGDGVCTESAVDTVRVRNLALLEDPAFAETVGAQPPAGWVRRVVEPAVLVAAVGVGVYLFFSLRSTSGSE